MGAVLWGKAHFVVQCYGKTLEDMVSTSFSVNRAYMRTVYNVRTFRPTADALSSLSAKYAVPSPSAVYAVLRANFCAREGNGGAPENEEALAYGRLVDVCRNCRPTRPSRLMTEEVVAKGE